MDRETPRSVMFDDLRKFGGITNRDTAWMLLRSTPMAGGKAPRDRVDERTFLSREVVHAPVERPRPELFADITQTAQNITARLISNLGGSEMARAMVAEHYSGEAADAMRESLSAYGLDDRIYRNACERIAAPGTTAADCALPLVTLFVACGCLCDPQAAVQVTETLIADKMGGHFSTTELSVGEGFTAAVEPEVKHAERLGLIRIVGNAAKPPLYPLNEGEGGTVIGSLATGTGAITDVDRDVSRRHARVFAKDGYWYVQGLGSTNGTVLISGADMSQHVVEPPRHTRRPGVEYPPVPLWHSDTICLGATTRFLVMKLAI